MDVLNPRSIPSDIITDQILPNIPFDIIADQILPRLPAKSLIRFTSVCKKWKGFIRSQHFIQAHLHHNRFEAKGKLEYPLIYHKQSLYAIDQNHKPLFFANLECPSDIIESSFDFDVTTKLVESCNGLILVKLCYDKREPFCKKRELVLLCNPCIQRIKLIQHYIHNGSEDYLQVFGLGFDESSKQHKVVKIRYVVRYEPLDDDIFNTIKTVDVEVYSSSLDSWHKVDSKPGKTIPSGYKDYEGVYLNGCMHWIVESDHRVYSIMLFDFENESFREMALPVPDKVKQYDFFDALIEYEGSLALMYVDRDDDENGTRFLWNMLYMTEYGVFESWTKKFSVILSHGFNFCYPYSFTKNGWLVYEEMVKAEEVFRGTRLKFVDVQNHQSKFIIEGFQNREIVINYIESLTLLC